MLFLRATIDALEYLNTFTVSARWLESLLEWRADGWAGASFLIYLAWSAAFWWSACRCYLRLPSPFMHAMVLFAMGTMLTAAVMYWTWAPGRAVAVDTIMHLL
jgi:hypothetical protein